MLSQSKLASMKSFLSIFLLIMMLSCKTISVDKILYLEAKFVGIGGDCMLPLLDFGSQQEQVEQLVSRTNPYKLYYAFSLDQKVQKTNTRLAVTIRKLKSNEITACSIRGLAYGSVYIVSAINK